MVTSRCVGQLRTVGLRAPNTLILPSLALGGWWTRPSNWKANTAILFAGILGVSYGVWTVSADREVGFPILYCSLRMNETPDL